jgi:hypothetical protein
MDVEKLAAKLEPLMPGDVEHWLRVRDTAESDLKALIDHEIAHTAHAVLGHFRSKILLSLPPERKANGTFNLGTILYEKEKWPVGISRSEFLQNLCIFGRSGAGKTNVAFHLLEQLVVRKIPFLFLDWKRTARHLIPRIKGKINIYTPGRPLSGFPFNPFIAPPGVEHNIYINHVVDVMAEAYTLGDGARSVLQKAIASCYKDDKWPTVSEVLVAVEKMSLKERGKGWQISAIRALESLKFSDLSSTEQQTQEQLLRTLTRENTIVELDGLNQSAKKFLIPVLCLWLYYVKLGSPEREKLGLAIFVEEAHHVLYRQEQRSKESLMNMLLRQCREIGIGMVVIDQHPHLISSAALGNTYTSICLNQKDPSDINRAAGLSMVDESDKRYFSMLPVGQGIVKLQDRWRNPFLVRFPLVDVRKGVVTDDVLKRFLRRCERGSAGRGFLGKEFGRVRQVRLADRVLEDEALRFIEDVIDHQDDGVKARYKRLGLSVHKGNRIKEALTEDGWLDAEIVKVGRSRKVLLRPTREARTALGIDANDAAFVGSVVHEYWKRFYARCFEERGYRVRLEAARVGGRVDVLACNGSERVGIEVETGKSHVVENVRQGLRSKLDRIIVVATDEAAMRIVERQLAKAGLIIPGRVELVLREGCFRKAA